MSIDSGGTATITKEETLEKKIDEEELEDGELSDDDDEPVPQQKQQQNNKDIKSKSNTINKTIDDKSTTNQQTNAASNKQTQQQLNRKRRRRSGSEDSEESLDGKRNKRSSTSNFNRNNKQSSNRNKRSSTDDDSDDEYPKIDQKMMFTMLKQMQEMLMNNDKSNKHNKQEYDKFFEKVKNSKGGNNKEMMKFLKKNEKMMMMMNQSSQDNNQPPFLNNQFNQGPPLFGPPGPMFGLQNNYGPGPLLGPPGPFNHPNNLNHQGPPFNHPPGGPFQNGPGPFNGPPGLLQPPLQNGPPNHHPNSIAQQQLDAQARLNDLARNQQVLAPQSSLTSTSSNKKQQQKNKRKSKKDDKDEFLNDLDLNVPKQLCKYFLEGHCQKGNNCDFIHQQPYNYKREVCKFYIQDSCGKGDNCTFLHKEFPCKLYHTGQDCIMGENCKFSHEPINDELKDIFINYLDNAELNEELNIAYGLSKNQQKKPPILGDVPEDVKSSYHTWVWQQEMKKLEVAYTGTKRNLFCIDDEFILKEEPDRDGYEDDLNEFSRDIDERQSNYFIDTHGDLNDEDDDEMEFDQNMFTKDNDLRKEFNQPQKELKSLDEVKKQWLNESEEEEIENSKSKKKNNDENKEEEEEDEEDKKKSMIDITKMLDAIRQTTSQTAQDNQKPSSDTNQSDKNQEFWRSILNGVNLNDSNKSSESESSITQTNKQSSNTTTATQSQPRDPRLAKQRNSQQNQINKQQQQKLIIQQSQNYKIPADEPFSWSIGDITFKLYKIDVEKIDYSPYSVYYDLDSKLKNDPRLQNFFTNNYSNQLNTSSSSLPNIISPTDILPPLTLSDSYSKKTDSIINKKNLIIPPPPTSNLSSLDLISPSIQSKPISNSQLSFQEQILASVSVPKKESINIPESGGLTSLADLVSSREIKDK